MKIASEQIKKFYIDYILNNVELYSLGTGRVRFFMKDSSILGGVAVIDSMSITTDDVKYMLHANADIPGCLLYHLYPAFKNHVEQWLRDLSNKNKLSVCTRVEESNTMISITNSVQIDGKFINHVEEYPLGSDKKASVLHANACTFDKVFEHVIEGQLMLPSMIEPFTSNVTYVPRYVTHNTTLSTGGEDLVVIVRTIDTVDVDGDEKRLDRRMDMLQKLLAVDVKDHEHSIEFIPNKRPDDVFKKGRGLKGGIYMSIFMGIYTIFNLIRKK